jgi:hypothetical protein
MDCHAATKDHCLKHEDIFREGVSQQAVQSQGVTSLRILEGATPGPGVRAAYLQEGRLQASRRFDCYICLNEVESGRDK